MKVLFLSQVLPYPLDAGPKVRSYYVLRYLAQHHEITLVTFVRREDKPAAIEHLRTFCREVHPVLLTRSRVRDVLHLVAALVKRKSFLILRDDLPVMHTAIRELLTRESFDAVHADQLSMAHYASPLGMRRILDEHNAVWTITRRMGENEANPFKRALYFNEARQVKRHEAHILPSFDQVITVTPQDAAALTFPGSAPVEPFRTIPICIDPSQTVPIHLDPRARDLVFLGSMLYPPNVDGVLWFAREVLPQIWKQAPDTKFFVVGARPARAVIELGKQEPRIVVTGYVEDATAYLARSAVFVVPLRAGGGMRVKILDAWAQGIPIVTTSLGYEGITAIPNEHLMVGDTPDEFSAAVLNLLANPAYAARMAQQGRNWVESQYDWKKIYPAFDTIYPFSDSPLA